MQWDRLADQAFDLFDAFPDHPKPRQLRSVGTVAGLAALDDDRVPAHFGPFNQACRRMLASVSGGRSALGLPATVTVPGLIGVTELAVAAGLPIQPPAIHLDESDHCADLHDRRNL